MGATLFRFGPQQRLGAVSSPCQTLSSTWMVIIFISNCSRSHSQPYCIAINRQCNSRHYTDTDLVRQIAWLHLLVGRLLFLLPHYQACRLVQCLSNHTRSS